MLYWAGSLIAGLLLLLSASIVVAGTGEARPFGMMITGVLALLA